MTGFRIARHLSIWPRLGRSQWAADTSVHQRPGTSQGCYHDVKNIERQRDETGVLRGTQAVPRGGLVTDFDKCVINGPPEGIRWIFVVHFSLLVMIISNLSTKEGWGAYKECDTDSEGQWCPQVTFDPFFKISCEIVEKNSYVGLLLDGMANLPDIFGEQLGEVKRTRTTFLNSERAYRDELFTFDRRR